MIQELKMKRSSWLAIACASLLALLIGFPGESLTRAPLPSFVYPLLGTRVSSDFGKRKHPVLHYQKHHDGIDLAAPAGATIRAINEGRVVFADPYGSYGNFIVIEHAGRFTSHYGHCETIKVKPGQKVLSGQVIGTVGRTGRVTGPHLHFEIRANGIAQDPEKFIPGLAIPAQG